MFTRLTTVLIIDDAEDFRVLLSRWIGSQGLDPLTAQNGLDAIYILEKQRIDIIITDFNMPKMDGLDFLQWCRSHSIHVPVVFMSASGKQFEREQIALQDCCATRLAKPIDFRILRAALEAAERREHHKDCLHQPFNDDVAEQISFLTHDLSDTIPVECGVVEITPRNCIK